MRMFLRKLLRSSRIRFIPFARFSTEIHAGIIHPRKHSKTEILFCWKPLFIYGNPEIFNDADLADVTVDEQSYIPIVDHVHYFGRFISTAITDDRHFDAWTLKAWKAFGSIWKSLFLPQCVHFSVKGSVYISFKLPIFLYGLKCCCLTKRRLQKLFSFHNRCGQAMRSANRMQVCLFRIYTTELLQRLSLSVVCFYLCQ